MYLQLQLMVEVVQHRVYIAPRQVPVSQQNCAVSRVVCCIAQTGTSMCGIKSCVCAMSSGRYLNLRGRGYHLIVPALRGGWQTLILII